MRSKKTKIVSDGTKSKKRFAFFRSKKQQEAQPTSEFFATTEEEAPEEPPPPLENVSSENLAKLPTLSEEEFKFFKLVQSADLVELKDFMGTPDFAKIHINKTDIFGFAALHHAVRRQDDDMVSLLLEQPGILLYDTLFHAIQEENVGITKKLLAYHDISHPPQRGGAIGWPLAKVMALTTMTMGLPTVLSPTNITTRRSLQDLEEFDSEFPQYFTPFMVAAQTGNAELMEIFYARGERLETAEENHNCKCTCQICVKDDKTLTRAYERMHLFSALTNPNYICFLSGKTKRFDPIHYAMEKIKKCRELVAREPFDDDYEAYIKRLGAFIRDFVDLCKTNEETETFFSTSSPMSEGRLRGKFPRLWDFVGLKLIDAVAHPHSQYIIYKQWVSEDWPAWTRTGITALLVQVLFRMILLPFIAVFMWFRTGGPIGRTMASPLSRYLNWMASYFLFLIILWGQVILPQRCNSNGTVVPYSIPDGECNERGPPRIGTEWGLVLFWFGFTVSMIKRHSIPWYWQLTWSWFDLVTQLLFLATFICWIWAWAENGHSEPRSTWDQYYPEVLGEIFLALACIGAFGRTFRFVQLHKTMGPLQMALGKMMRSFPATALVYSIVLFSFSMGLNAIYVPFDGLDGVDESKNKTEKKQESPFGKPIKAPEELFWSLYGLSGSDKPHLVSFTQEINETTKEIHHHIWNERAGKMLFGCFHILGVLMMFNMLVAYFTASADEVTNNSDAAWKFGRTEVYMMHIKDTILPPPFNLIPTRKSIVTAFTFLMLMCCSENDRYNRKSSCSFKQCCFIETPVEKDIQKQKSYRRLILELTHRYKNMQVDKANELTATSDDVKEIGEELAELKSQIHSKLREFQKEVQNQKGSQGGAPPSDGDGINKRKPSTFLTVLNARRLSKAASAPLPADDGDGDDETEVPRKSSMDGASGPEPEPAPEPITTQPKKSASPLAMERKPSIAQLDKISSKILLHKGSSKDKDGTERKSSGSATKMPSLPAIAENTNTAPAKKSSPRTSPKTSQQNIPELPAPAPVTPKKKSDEFSAPPLPAPMILNKITKTRIPDWPKSKPQVPDEDPSV